MALKIYKIRPDYTKFSLRPIDQIGLTRPEYFRLEPMEPAWKPITFYVLDPLKTEIADFMNISHAGLAFGKRLLDTPLREIISGAGELLDAKLEEPEEDFYLFNLLVSYNCLDRKNSKMRMSPDGKRPIQILKHAFHPERIGDYNIFKIPEEPNTAIYVLSGRDEPHNEFYHQYHAGKFTGLVFEEVWAEGA